MAVGPGKTLEQLKQEGWSEPAATPAPADARSTFDQIKASPNPTAATMEYLKSNDPNDLASPVGPGLREKLETPLWRPTGIDAIDSILSPAGLAQIAVVGGPMAAKAVTGAVNSLKASVGEKLAGKILDFVKPSILDKSQKGISILSDLAEAIKGKGAAPEVPPMATAALPEAPAAPQAQTPTPAPVASPAQPQPAVGDIPVVNRTATAADYASDIAHMRARGQTPSPQIEALARGEPAAPMSTPDAFRSALKAFADAKEVPRPAEVNNVQMLIKRGVDPDKALQTVLGNRPPAPANPAAELAKRLGTPSEAEMNADMRQRALSGQKSLMPKYGGESTPTPQATSTPDYIGSHRPTPDGPPAHDLLAGDIAPKDIYEHPEWYVGDPRAASTRQTVTALRKIRGKPDATVTIYRAAPKNELNSGDWVSLSKDYAKQHGMANDPSEDIPVHAFQVKASDIKWAGDDLGEFGYYPKAGSR